MKSLKACARGHEKLVVFLSDDKRSKLKSPPTGMEMEQVDLEAMRGCEGGEGAEECQMRRTLVAHTDYIYTQGKHN